MNKIILLFLSVLVVPVGVRAAEEPPVDWIDPDTGHRVVRLSREANTVSLYFHQDAFTRDGKQMVVITPGGLGLIDLATRETKLIAPGVKYRAQSSSGLEVGLKTGRIYYVHEGAVFSVDPSGGQAQRLCELPKGGAMSDINADETLLVGALTDGGAKKAFQ
jgi:oligogalacturonide lyase